MSESNTAPGWYADPQTPGYERRSDGVAWAGTPHRAANPNVMFGAAYARAFWSNANRILIVERVAAAVLASAFLAYVILAATTSPLSFSSRPGILAALAIVGLLAAIVVIVTSSIGLTRMRRLGGTGLAVAGLVSGVVLGPLSLLLLALVAMTTTAVP